MKKQRYLDFIQKLLDNEQDFQDFQACYQQRLSKSIKLLGSKEEKADLIDELHQQGRNLKTPDLSSWKKSYDDVLLVSKDDATTLGNHAFHQTGYFYVQEVAAGLSAQILAPEKGDLILDLCSAPGGKSVQLADQLLAFWAGAVLANEPSNPRRKALIFNLNRCWLSNTAVSAYDGTQIGDLAPEQFDKVLVDAPCSGEGMQYKHDKTVTFRDQKAADKLAKLQHQLLISGLKALKVWWTLVYSTCTLNPFENEGVLASVLQTLGNAVILEEVPIDQKSPGFQNFKNQTFLSPEEANKVARFRPHLQHTGGFFIAKFRKLNSFTSLSKRDKRTLLPSSLDRSRGLQEKVRATLHRTWGIPQQSAFRFFASSQAVYCTTLEKTQLPPSLFIEKIWIPIFKLGFKGDRIPQQGLARIFGAFASKNTYELNIQQLQTIIETKELSLDEDLSWAQEFVILNWKGKGQLLAKSVAGVLKSKIGT